MASGISLEPHQKARASPMGCLECRRNPAKYITLLIKPKGVQLPAPYPQRPHQDSLKCEWLGWSTAITPGQLKYQHQFLAHQNYNLPFFCLMYCLDFTLSFLQSKHPSWGRVWHHQKKARSTWQQRKLHSFLFSRKNGNHHFGLIPRLKQDI